MRHVTALPALAAWIALALIGCATAPLAQPRPEAPRLAEIPVVDLPPQARQTLELIRQGGPFPYERDGVRFGNRERLLPRKAHDYYREYTVPTPGVRTRGARRIVCGGPRTTPDVCYYTRDHYQSFARIRP